MLSKKKKFQSSPIGPSSQEDLNIHIPMESIAEKEAYEALPDPIDFSSIKPSIRYQFRGIARKALSYHRRQRITNIGCLVIWPVILVVICHILDISSYGKREGLIRYCTNEADPQFGRIFDLSEGGFFREDNNVYNSPFYPKAFETFEYEQFPCVRWFGESYPVKAPYQNATWASPTILDVHYTPSPDFGWFNLSDTMSAWSYNFDKKLYDMYKFPLSPGTFQFEENINQTVLYSTANSNVAKTLGMVANVTKNFQSDSWPPTDPSIVLYNLSHVDYTRGLLGAIPLRYYKRENYERSSNGTFLPAHMFSAGPIYRYLDSKEQMTEEIQKLARTSARDIYFGDDAFPFGGVHYDALDVEGAKVTMTMQFGLLSIGINPLYSSFRQIVVMTQMTNALARLRSKGQYIISQGIRALPYEFQWSRLNNRAAGRSSGFMFPFALSFLLPIFVSILVAEKEGRHRMMMSMNGLKALPYYLAHYVEFMVMQLILTLVFALSITATKNEFVWNTNTGLIILLFLLWAHIQTTLSFFLAVFFSKTRTATLVVYFLVSLSAILASISDIIFTNGVHPAWNIHPTFAFFGILKMGLIKATMINGLYPLSFADFTVGSDLLTCVFILLGESILFLLLVFYLESILPSEYGVRRPWHFPISDLLKSRSYLSTSRRDIESRSKQYSRGNIIEDDDSGDSDVRAERDRVRAHYDPETTPLIIDNLFHHYYGKADPSLKGISFGVEKNSVLGLLGPNGAGKSTLIHLLTGLYEPTSGTAFVAGANIRTEMSIVHSRTGVCPQHDILWEDLTVADHLLFYSRLRGVPPSLEQQAIKHAIASVSLTRFCDRQVKGLSGGERRRVSIAISLLGDNRVVFLDEPSTGLDPEVRRVIWDIVNRVKINRTVVLTTHSMEEADILSDRIAIMSGGQLRCIGTSLHLKELYGSGFRLNISSKPGCLEEACKSIEDNLMNRIGLSYRRMDKFTNASVFEFDISHSKAGISNGCIDEIDLKRGELSSVFYYLSQSDLFPLVEDWGISRTTLEDVFIKIVTDADSDLKVPTILSGGDLTAHN